MAMPKISEHQVVNSALWAAYGDAIGFPSELVSSRELEKRIGTPDVDGPVDWCKRTGGMFGPEVRFAAGSYSDDTQLRLAVCRAIAGNGFFDVESFAKIELPVWLNYALGAGRASKLAASNLALRDPTWSHNFFKGNHVDYWNGGGNGAAMRIQPHVWAVHRMGAGAFMGDVVRNAVCTHGHPRALMGAAVHAHALHVALQNGRVSAPEEWAELGSVASAQAYQSLLDDQELALVWIPQWEQLSGSRLRALWDTTTTEWIESCRTAVSVCRTTASPDEQYTAVLAELGGYSGAERGSGLKTPLYANVLAWLFRDEGPRQALLAAANALGSDTDTIGTMAGAIIGAVSSTAPSEPVQDAAYIASEARRLFAIGLGREQPGFDYPDLMKWSAPRAQTDAWVHGEGGAALMALGTLTAAGPEFSAPNGPGHIYQWCTLPFGQTVLAKRKKSASPPGDGKATGQPRKPPSSRHQDPRPEHATAIAPDPGADLHTRTRDCIRGGFQAGDIGEHLLALMSGPDGIERAIAFAAIIAKAKLARDLR
jgi:ADP-ribosylglycohydrolase